MGAQFSQEKNKYPLGIMDQIGWQFKVLKKIDRFNHTEWLNNVKLIK
jgi:hypothetical protein